MAQGWAYSWGWGEGQGGMWDAVGPDPAVRRGCETLILHC